MHPFPLSYVAVSSGLGLRAGAGADSTGCDEQASNHEGHHLAVRIIACYSVCFGFSVAAILKRYDYRRSCGESRKVVQTLKSGGAKELYSKCVLRGRLSRSWHPHQEKLV